MRPPPLKNDCFALPPGVHWTPVDAAHTLLRDRLQAVTEIEDLPITAVASRYLAAEAVAVRDNPPTANSAVDGYGFAGPIGDGVHTLPLSEGRAAAGVPFDGVLPAGKALRVLTGATLPPGVDTVVLEEDVRLEDGQIAFNGPLKLGANARKAGEDVVTGSAVLGTGTRIGAPEIAVLAATGVSTVSVRKPLRIGVLSTGDELRPVGGPASDTQIFDANRPMLLSLIANWGHRPVDLGHVIDDKEVLRAALDQAASQADVILTSGGASAGDEDHVSALLTETGTVALWRIAIKPGRPLALAMWRGVPVFGLPGNPVAAFVCTLIFAEPAFRVLAGGEWRLPQGFTVPAAFAKSKKPGRREYLRARLTPEGAAEVFQSEGSGRVSGLAWADGLVELEDGARQISPGDPVRFLPFSGFGCD